MVCRRHIRFNSQFPPLMRVHNLRTHMRRGICSAQALGEARRNAEAHSNFAVGLNYEIYKMANADKHTPSGLMCGANNICVPPSCFRSFVPLFVSTKLATVDAASAAAVICQIELYQPMNRCRVIGNKWGLPSVGTIISLPMQHLRLPSHTPGGSHTWAALGLGCGRSFAICLILFSNLFYKLPVPHPHRALIYRWNFLCAPGEYATRTIADC